MARLLRVGPGHEEKITFLKLEKKYQINVATKLEGGGGEEGLSGRATKNNNFFTASLRSSSHSPKKHIFLTIIRLYA